jgi:hypothetical protein
MMLRRSKIAATGKASSPEWAMFGLVLSFVVCLAAHDGGRCQNVELPFEGSMQLRPVRPT